MKEYLSLLLILVSIPHVLAQNKIDISGNWEFAMDPSDKGITERWYAKSFDEFVKLPGSMTENGKGFDISLDTKWTGDILDSSFFKLPQYERFRQKDNFKVPFWLQPIKSYYGVAWYKKEINIPAEWKDKIITVFFERCHWQTSLWIDDVYIGSQNSLSTPHKFTLPGNITVSKHVFTVRVDNRINEINPGVNSSSITDHSQTNWNGIVGEMNLTAYDKIHFGNINISTDIITKTVLVEIEIENSSNQASEVDVILQALVESNSPKSPLFNEYKKKITVQAGINKININYMMGSSALLWDEFNTNLYKLNCSIISEGISDYKSEIFGFRKISTEGTQFKVNNRLTFFRGTLECAIFPKTGYPPTDVKEWTRIFRICKNHGLNHMRFHSWCPPEAAFIAADNVGIYLHIECASWANQGSSLGDGKPIDKYIIEESERIVKEYGNHPSFCFLLYGNEPAGINHQKYLTEFVSYWKKKDNRRLYSGAAGWPQLEVNDFHSMYEPRIQLWGAGLNSIINSQPPSSNYDWYNIINWRGKPVISHEIGQWCVYPNFKEIQKYNGVLKAKNFEIFQQTLKDNAMEELADSFFMASGKLQVLCYKAEIEATLRTKDMGGFQLLDLHDFPGQGTALVGVLDPFWEEKNYVTADEYKRFCNTTVPLACFSKFIFNSKENLHAELEIAHFGPEPLIGVIPLWKIIDDFGNVIKTGTLGKVDIQIGNGIKLGEIRVPLSEFKSPAMFTFIMNVGNFSNQWDFWIFPYKNSEPIFSSEIKIAQRVDDEVINYLIQGGKVLLTPIKGSFKPKKGGNIAVGFSSIFWNTAWTSKQAPHTLGILCNPQHSLLKEFPTQYHSNFQWWDAMSHSNAILLNALGENIQPIVRIIDDWFTNRPLGLIIEAKVGKGKLILTGIDLLTDAEKRPEARQLMQSIIHYMRSNAFSPSQEIYVEKLKELFEK
jgi:hypothetical protein